MSSNFNRHSFESGKMKLGGTLGWSIVILAILLVSGIVAVPRANAFANGQSASIVIGYNNFTSRNGITPPTQSSLLSPNALTFDSNGNLWIVDSADSRVLEFKPPFTTGESDSTVLGSSSFVSSGILASSNQTDLVGPSGLALTRQVT